MDTTKMATNFPSLTTGTNWVDHTITSGVLVSALSSPTESIIHILAADSDLFGMRLVIGTGYIQGLLKVHTSLFKFYYIIFNEYITLNNPTISPSEPVFVPRPNAYAEDDGAVLSLVSPLSDDTLRPFIVVLDGRTLEELTRIYLPEYIHVPVGFHSSWVPDETVQQYQTRFSRKRYRYGKQPWGL